MFSCYYTPRNELVSFFLLKQESLNGFDFDDYYNAALKLVNLKTANVMSKDIFCDYVSKDVVLAAVSHKSLKEGNLLCGLAILKLDMLKEPYPGFCKDFNIKMELVKKIIIVDSDDDNLILGMLRRIEQNVKYAGSTGVIAELELTDFAMQYAFLQAGYRLKIVESGDASKVLAFKDICKTEAINIFLKDQDAEEQALYAVLADDTKSTEEKQAAEDAYQKSISTDYFKAMEEYSVEDEGKNLKAIAVYNKAKLLDIMSYGYLIAGLREGKYWCYQYADACVDLQVVEETEQSNVA